MNKMKTIMVTGGAGFIGSHLCKFLLEKGHEVICVDNFFTGNKRNIHPLLGNKHFEVLRHDIIHPLSVEVDQIYNLACPASPVHYQHDPIQTIRVSTVGTYNMLELAERIKARILQASTSEVYGDPTQHPQKETYWGNVNCTGPRACYDEGKRVAESQFIAYHDQGKVDTRIVRIFNTYGPNMAMNDGRVVSNFILQALRNEDITIYGDGSQTRSFCFVTDLVKGLYLMMEQNEHNGPINLGNPTEFTIKQLAEKTIELTGASSSLTFRDLPKDDPTQRQPDITLAKQTLGWQPTIELDKGLKQTIDYFRKLLEEEKSS